MLAAPSNFLEMVQQNPSLFFYGLKTSKSTAVLLLLFLDALQKELIPVKPTFETSFFLQTIDG